MTVESARMSSAQAAIRAGKKQQARRFLQEELQHNPDNFRAWLWLAGLANSAQASLDYVRRAERLNPMDVGVQKARDWAEQRLARQAANGGSTGQQMEEPAATPAEGISSSPVEALREQQRVASERPRSRRHVAALAAIVLLLVALLVVGFTWGEAALNLVSRALPAGAAPSPQVAAAITATPTPTSVQPDQTAAEPDTLPVNFVSGHFAPALVQESPEPDETPVPEPTSTSVVSQAKPVSQNNGEPRATWTLTPSPTFTPTATPTPAPTFVSEEVVVGGALRPAGVGPNERWIDVDLTTQRLVAYEGDRAVFDSLISSGTWLHPTVTGQFRVWLRYTSQTMDGRRLGYDYYLPNVPYVMYFYRDYALHGTYWHNNFGTPMSHGCVNLPTPAAEWIFNWSSMGTLVNVHY